MLLVVNTANLISDERYLNPVLELLDSGYYTRHFLELEGITKNIGKVIIAGNSIFSVNPSVREIKSRFSWLETFDKPILGICAGQQIIAEHYGSRLRRNDSRGLKKFSIHHRDKILRGVGSKFSGYVAHNFSVPCPKNFEILASASGETANAEYLAKHKKKDIYISTFHPEFSENKILHNFVNLV